MKVKLGIMNPRYIENGSESTDVGATIPIAGVLESNSKSVTSLRYLQPKPLRTPVRLHFHPMHQQFLVAELPTFTRMKEFN